MTAKLHQWYWSWPPNQIMYRQYGQLLFYKMYSESTEQIFLLMYLLWLYGISSTVGS